MKLEFSKKDEKKLVLIVMLFAFAVLCLIPPTLLSVIKDTLASKNWGEIELGEQYIGLVILLTALLIGFIIYVIGMGGVTILKVAMENVE